MNKRFRFSVYLLLLNFTIYAQQYTVNGSAVKNNCHCYTLTPNLETKSGSVWNNIKIDLSQSFDFVFTVNLGCVDFNGADGIAFVLQPISTSVGTTGNGLGFGGVIPSVGITLDTYQNGDDNDPYYDHIAIQKNGDLNHLSANNLAGPVEISANSDNVEDCQDHSFRIVWNASTKTLDTYFDEVQRLSINNDLVNTIFNGDPLVYWGFTGATGGLFNQQSFCTALTPKWTFSPAQKRCFGEPIQFHDATLSFTTIAKFYWDFGDGSNIDSVHLDPIHTYATPGDYTVKQKVRGADGCEETNTQSVRVGSKPVAGFSVADSCVANTIVFADTSRVAVGTVNSWYWNMGVAGVTSYLQNPGILFPGYGLKNVSLAVKSLEGCVSDTLHKTIKIRAQPTVDFNFTDSVCLGSPTAFSKSISYPDGYAPDGPLWQLDGPANTSTANTPQYIYGTAGNHTVLLTSGFGTGNCKVTTQKTVFITSKPFAAAKMTLACEAQRATLLDSSYSTDGLAITGWWWDLGNGQYSTLKDPFTTYTTTSPVTVRHVVYNSKGCASDTFVLKINIVSRPVANFGVGEALCNNDSVNFFDSSSSVNGNIMAWSWINNNTVFSTQQNGTGHFSAGANKAGLVVMTGDGCLSDTVYKTFNIKLSPRIAMDFKDACKFAPVDFVAKETTTNVNIEKWTWDFGDGVSGEGAGTSHSYTANGNYPVRLTAVSVEGCISDTLKSIIHIYGTNAFAGSDTIAAAGQPVPLHASGGLSYLWVSGAEFLSNASIANPIAILNNSQTFRLKAFTPEGCESFDEVTVKIYNGPEIYLPSAFTPNNDGLNDVYRGIYVGLQKFGYFHIYNRWGQLLFSSNSVTEGWDGRYRGLDQEPGTFVVIVGGTDFRGKLIERKASFQLLR